ncbi:chaperone protein dnaJ 8, chloroplastic-like [Canna indica]|uniref:Chaperone protein dnaJ 8, chloroplastic-like n=1 Tax=Canna indica TaxID=4628 RepID=A0AAQ3QMH3_9LILI|nr:chaperone protein dnaJ 8, chloroplastic-like [Canna indica]
MAISIGMWGSMGASSVSPVEAWIGRSRVSKGRRRRSGANVTCAIASGGLMDQYRTLRIQPGASEKEIKKAFRQLALQYHPDVCKGSDCGVQFHRINEAYDIVMSSLRSSKEEEAEQWQSPEWSGDEESTSGGTYDPNWDLWEEWMGWEGAGIRDYSSHINPYI